MKRFDIGRVINVLFYFHPELALVVFLLRDYYFVCACFSLCLNDERHRKH